MLTAFVAFAFLAGGLLPAATVDASKSIRRANISSQLEDTPAKYPLESNRALKKRKKKKGKGRGRNQILELTVTNLSRNQPFSPFFVMVHDDPDIPLYVQGTPPSEVLARLAEDGDADPAVEFYRALGTANGVLSAEVGPNIPPLQTAKIMVTVTKEFPQVTIASMAVNTNDCFVAINGAEPYPGQVLMSDGLDAGSELNSEDCDKIPGPACEGVGTEPRNMDAEEEGEGYVHVNAGVHGVSLEDITVNTDLNPAAYDWRNPMMRVSVAEYDD